MTGLTDVPPSYQVYQPTSLSPYKLGAQNSCVPWELVPLTVNEVKCHNKRRENVPIAPVLSMGYLHKVPCSWKTNTATEPRGSNEIPSVTFQGHFSRSQQTISLEGQ